MEILIQDYDVEDPFLLGFAWECLMFTTLIPVVKKMQTCLLKASTLILPTFLHL